MKRADVLMATVAEPTSVTPEPAVTVTAPEAEPRLMITRSNELLTLALTSSASSCVPVAVVTPTAEALVNVYAPPVMSAAVNVFVVAVEAPGASIVPSFTSLTLPSPI